jgi:predicted glycoside hydrolase/deacetylase ChbG (UPF0249 family)
MKKILIHSDDYGITYGGVDGTIRAITDGIVRNTGIFINMKCAPYAIERIKDVDVCLGIDINLAAGSPVSPLEQVPHLVRSDGHFKSSRQIINENKLIRTNKYLYYFEEDPYCYEEVLIETENQVKKFIEMFGHVPEYINSHSVITENTERAAKVVAEKYGIKKRSSDLYFNDKYIDLAYSGDYSPMSLEEQIKVDYKPFAQQAVKKIQEGDIAYFIFHCAYIDKDLFNESSLTIQRMNDVACAVDKGIFKILQDNNIELITYRDI